ncbi:hypothetical protein MRX96_005830 [Rhipicephalus microplus]
MVFFALPPEQPSKKLATRRHSMSCKPPAELVNIPARGLSTSSKPSIEIMKETLELQPLPVPIRKSSKSRSSSLSSSKSTFAFPSEDNKQHGT